MLFLNKIKFKNQKINTNSFENFLLNLHSRISENNELNINKTYIKGERINNASITDEIRDAFKIVKASAIIIQGVISALFTIFNILLMNIFYLLEMDNIKLRFIFHFFSLCAILTLSYASIVFFSCTFSEISSQHNFYHLKSIKHKHTQKETITYKQIVTHLKLIKTMI